MADGLFESGIGFAPASDAALHLVILNDKLAVESIRELAVRVMLEYHCVELPACHTALALATFETAEQCRGTMEHTIAWLGQRTLKLTQRLVLA